MKDTLNLLPAELRAKRPFRPGPLMYALLTAVLYVGFMAGAWIYNTIETRDIAEKTLVLEAKRLELMAAIQAAAVKPVPAGPGVEAEVSRALETAMPWDALLGEVSRVVPEKAWLVLIDTEVRGDVTYMRFKGMSKTKLAIADLIARLEASRFFEDVELVYAEQGDADAAFELRARVRWA